MKNVSLEKVAAWSHGELVGFGIIDGVQVDSRLVGPGDLFVCLKGERVDGHNYALQAARQGARALMVDHHLSHVGIPQIIVDDTLEGLRRLAKGYKESLDVFTIAITGSNGKTSTKDILKSILEQVAPTIVTYKNQNTEIGTYLNVFRMDEETRYGVFEMGLDMPNDVRIMSTFLKPNACIITSLAPTHVVNFENIEHLAAEKFAIIEGVQDKNLVFYQGDYDLYRTMDKGYHTFGSRKTNETIYSNVKSGNDGISFEVNGETYTCNLLGEHQASNCAGVIALMRELAIDDSIVRIGLNKVALTSLRTELVEKRSSLVILDAYKSNPDSTRFALHLLKDYNYDGRRIAVLSDMRELGPNSLEYHIDTLRVIADLNIDMTYFYGPEFKIALETGVLDASKYRHFVTFESLYEDVQSLFNEHQLILIKGSRYFALERLMEEA